MRVTADLDLVGRIVQLGRGMIESVNRQMFKQFTECAQPKLETPAAAAGPPGPTSGTSDSPTGATATSASALPAGQPVRLLPVLLLAAVEWIVGLARALWRWGARLWQRGAA